MGPHSRQLHERRLQVEERIIRPLIERLINTGVLPEPTSFSIHWSDSSNPSDLSRDETTTPR